MNTELTMSKFATQSDYWKERAKQAEEALFDVVDAVASLDKPWDLERHGIESLRAEEICEIAARGKPSSPR